MTRPPLLFLNVLIVATCGLIYELLAGTLASYVLGDSVTQFSLIIGIYLFAMGVGTSRALLFRDDHLVPLTTNRMLHKWLGVGHARTSDNAPPDLRHANEETTGEQPDDPGRIEQVQLASGDRLVLCTNGLTDFVEEREIAEALTSRRHPREQCQELVDLALAAGSADDITVVVADYHFPRRRASDAFLFGHKDES